ALEALARHRGLTVGLITKSPLVARDIDVLRRVAERHALSVHISLITLDADIARRLEPRSPAPHARLRALERLRQAGLAAGLMMAPIVPLLTDSTAALRLLFAAARDAGAGWVHGHPLRLGEVSRRRFLPHLMQEFPGLAQRYRDHFGPHTHVRAEYRAALRRRLHRLQAEFGFARQPRLPLEVARASAAPPQLTLLAPLPPS
ncbi:MAG: hypothetical protein MUC69_09610, partial [Gemmatimonadales bacterium]|nr:hypothetical protein [Gemmatimonadales bacterium]